MTAPALFTTVGILIAVAWRLVVFWRDGGFYAPRTGPGTSMPNTVRLPNPRDSKRQQRRDAEDVARFEEAGRLYWEERNARERAEREAT